MKQLSFLFITLSIFAISSCSVINPELNEVQVQLENVSDVTIENINFGGIEYGTLTSGKISEYHVHEYFNKDMMPYCEGTIDGQKVGNMMWIICFIDDIETLAPGKYTIEVDYEQTEEGAGVLQLKFKE